MTRPTNRDVRNSASSGLPHKGLHGWPCRANVVGRNFGLFLQLVPVGGAETESPPGCEIRMGGATRFLRNASRSIGRNDNTASWAGAFKPKRYKWGRPVTLPTCLCPSQLINSSEAAESVITKLGLQRVSGPHVAGFRISPSTVIALTWMCLLHISLSLWCETSLVKTNLARR